MTEDSLKKRYLYKLVSNLIGFGIGLVTAGIVPRALGPSAYGNFSFLTNLFSQIISFFDMGTSSAFYIKLSQRLDDYKLITFYLFVSVLIVLITFLMVTASFIFGVESILWPEQESLFIWAAAIWGIMSWFAYHVMNKVIDAYGLTVVSEKVIIIQKIFSIVLLLILFFSGLIRLKEYFLYHYIIIGFLCFAWWRVLSYNGIYLFKKLRLTYREIISYSKEFYHYIHPLIIYSIVGLITGIFDRWLLQRFAGSLQQGFYGLSYNIGAVCFLFTSAMTPLLMREFSRAFGSNDLSLMRELFSRYIPLLYSIAAFFSVFIAMQAEKISRIFGGVEFRGAIVPISIMAFYPIHQTYGQLSGSVFYATGQTYLYRNIGIAFMLIGLPITYFMIAPRGQWGIGTGATGLAIKMVTLQFIAVNVQLYFNAKFLNLSFWRYLGHQIISVGFFLAVAFISSFGVDKIFGLYSNLILNFLLSGVLYAVIVICIVYYLPAVFGLKRGDIQYLFQRLRRIAG